MKNNIYDQSFVQALFNQMCKTYEITNTISSFGFSERWRKQCVSLVAIKPGMLVCDMMSGMGECWPSIGKKLGRSGRVIGIDFSSEMCQRAVAVKNKHSYLNIDILEKDALRNEIPTASIDCVISSFGLKTLSDDKKKIFAQEIKRILKPDGVFSLVEISVPENFFLKFWYMFYLKYFIPIIGNLLGNPDNYRMLGVYTSQFENCKVMHRFLEEEGLKVSYHRFFFGCATAVFGTKQGGSFV